MKLSAVLIVKNEEACLADCLETIKEADEIIICDTGSKDKTIDIAKKYTDKIFHFEWCDDFAKARNYAKQFATGDWILSIDADEKLEENGIQKIKDTIAKTNNRGLNVKMWCKDNYFYVIRVFKNIPEIEWTGIVHNVIALPDYDQTDIAIEYGHSPAHELDPNRALRMLLKAHEKDPNNTRTMYYLGREYTYKHDWDKAIEIFEKYLPKATFLAEKADAYFLLACSYWVDGKGNGEKARQACLNAININANFKAAIELMAKMSWEHNAKQWLKMAQTADNSNTLFARQ